jgi:hypothetical protein
MDQTKEKLRLIFYPYLAVAGSFIIGYSYLNWFLTIHTNTLSVKEEITDIFAPTVIAILPVIIWLLPKIKLLTLKTKQNKSNVFGVAMLVVIAIGAPTMVAQNYMRTAKGKLTTLNKISEIDQKPATKFYALKNHFIDKENKRLKYSVHVTGKTGSRLNLDIYIAAPIRDEAVTVTKQVIEAPTESNSLAPLSTASSVQANNNALIILDEMIVEKSALATLSPVAVFDVTVLKGEAAKALYGDAAAEGAIVIRTKKFAHSIDYIITPGAMFFPKAWLCVSYHNQISNRLSEDEEMSKREIFYKESMNDFSSKDLNSFIYLERMGNNNNRDKYKAAINNSTLINLPEPVILEPKFTPFDQRNGNKLAWTFGALAIGSFVFLMIVLFAKFNEVTPEHY